MVSAWKLWRSAGDSGGMVELKFSENTSLMKDAFSMFVEATTEPDFNVGIKEEAFLKLLLVLLQNALAPCFFFFR